MCSRVSINVHGCAHVISVPIKKGNAFCHGAMMLVGNGMPSASLFLLSMLTQLIVFGTSQSFQIQIRHVEIFQKISFDVSSLESHASSVLRDEFVVEFFHVTRDGKDGVLPLVHGVKESVHLSGEKIGLLFLSRGESTQRFGRRHGHASRIPSPTAIAKFTTTIDATHSKTFHVDDETDVVQFVPCKTQHCGRVSVLQKTCSEKTCRVSCLFIDLGSRSSLEGRTSGDWFGQIVRFVPLFLSLGIHGDPLIQPPVYFSLGFFVSPLEERALSLGALEIKAMSVLVRSRQGKYERELAKTTHAGRIKAGRSGHVDGM